MVEQYATQAEQLQAQFQQLYNQAVNMQKIPVQLWPSIASELTTLVNLVGNAQGLSYASRNTVSAIQAQYGQPNAALSNYSGSLSSWTSNNDNQIAATLQQYNLNSQNYQSVQSALAAINTQSQTANGRMAVLQAGNQIFRIDGQPDADAAIRHRGRESGAVERAGVHVAQPERQGAKRSSIPDCAGSGGAF